MPLVTTMMRASSLSQFSGRLLGPASGSVLGPDQITDVRSVVSLQVAAFSGSSPRWVRAQIAAWVRFSSLSFRRMVFICTFTVNSVITSLSAMTLFDAPSVSVRRITNSRRDSPGTTSPAVPPFEVPGVSSAAEEAKRGLHF